MSRDREQMWRKFRELRISSQFREIWKSFIDKVMKDPMHPHLYQHITEILFRTMVQVKVAVLIILRVTLFSLSQKVRRTHYDMLLDMFVGRLQRTLNTQNIPYP